MRCYLFLFIFILPSLVNAKDIYVGTSLALTGPTGFLGREMRLGMEAAFYEVNSKGGVNDNIINLIAMDDKYEPFYTELNMKRFASDDNFIAVLGNIGTPNAKAALPIAQDYNLPLIGAFTGSNLLRMKPPSPYIINYRASYGEEINQMIKGIFKAGITIDEIAFFTQDDDYGDSGYLGIIKALNLFNIDIAKIQEIPHGRYVRNTSYVKEGLQTITKTGKNIKAFIIIGTYAPAAKFIKLAKEHYPSAYFFNVSFVGAEALMHELCRQNTMLCHEYTRNVVITQVVPYLDGNFPIIKDYKQALTTYLAHNTKTGQHQLKPFEKKANSISLEGYIVGKMFIKALQNIKQPVNRQSLIEAFNELGDFDLGLGHKLYLAKDAHQASSAVLPVTINNNQISRFSFSSIIDREDIKSTWRQMNQERD